ncbi:MAG: HAD-IA family hydrolase [Pirellulales bacterium]
MNTTDELRAVVFDLDGLIANTEDLYELAGDDILGRRGKTHDHALRVQMMGRPVADSFRIMIDYHALPDTLDALLLEVQEVLARLMASSLAAMPGVFELLDKLAAVAMPIAVATSGTRNYADDVLTRLDLKNRFRFILTAEDIRRGKPDPEIYLLAASRLQLAPPAMMVLEDSGNGCAAAVAAGAFTVAVPNRHTREHDFNGARLVANTLADPRICQALQL